MLRELEAFAAAIQAVRTEMLCSEDLDCDDNEPHVALSILEALNFLDLAKYALQRAALFQARSNAEMQMGR